MLFDSHAHYYDRQFDGDRDGLLENMEQNGIKYIMNPGCNVKSSKESVALSEKYGFIYAAAGIHPGYVNNAADSDFEEIKALSKSAKVKAIGEIGLDYHYDDAVRTTQRDAFARQLALADEMKLPVIIHSRDATHDCIDVLRSEYKGGGGLMHCFGESQEISKILLDMGFYFSFGGTLTFKNNVRAVAAAKYIPLDRILIETDAPYLAPVPFRGKRNSSLYLHYVLEKLAEIKGILCEEAALTTYENAVRFFSV